MEDARPVRALTAVTAAASVAGLAAIAVAPEEATQGIAQKIFYVHVPSAWVAYLAFAVVLIASIAYLKSEQERWDLVAHSSAEIGVLFTGITLVTGMLWAKPVWGTYWTWDPRLTLTLVLFLIYVAYLAFRSTAEPGRTERISAVIGIVGFVTVPLVHFSVDWWRGQHPGRVVVTPDSPDMQLSPQMLWTLLVMVGVFTLLYTTLMAMRVRLGRIRKRADAIEAA